jgi:hypothetical protein
LYIGHREIGVVVHNELCYNKKLKPEDLRKGVVRTKKVTVASHGFDGSLGLCVGHPLLTQMAIEAEKAQPVSTFEDFAKQKAAEAGGATMTLQQLLEEWNETNPKPEKLKEVSVGTNDNNSCTSSITTTTPVS